MTQRLENTEKGSKNDITELFSRIKRYEEEARIDNDEVNLKFQQKKNTSFFSLTISGLITSFVLTQTKYLCVKILISGSSSSVANNCDP